MALPLRCAASLIGQLVAELGARILVAEAVYEVKRIKRSFTFLRLTT